jgi:hypothetical protein
MTLCITMSTSNWALCYARVAAATASICWFPTVIKYSRTRDLRPFDPPLRFAMLPANRTILLPTVGWSGCPLLARRSPARLCAIRLRATCHVTRDGYPSFIVFGWGWFGRFRKSGISFDDRRSA